MAFSFRTTTSAQDFNAGSMVVTKPTGTVDGDLMVMVIATVTGDDGQHSPPGGWTQIGATSYANGFKLRMYYRVAASEGASYTLTKSGTAFSTVLLHTIIAGGFNASSIIDVTAAYTTAAAGGNGNIVSPTITTLNYGDLVFSVHAYAQLSGALTLTTPGGTVSRGFAVGSGPGIRAVTFEQTNPAATGTHTSVANDINNAKTGVKFAIRAANVAPTAPTALSFSGQTFDRAQAQALTYTFNDPGDSQSAYRYRYRIIGAPSWTTSSQVSSPTASIPFSGSFFAAGDYEIQVATYDSIGAPGFGSEVWSASANFTAADVPGAPSITSPSGGSTVSAAATNAVWSASSQTHYQVRRVADAAGSPNTSTVYEDSGEIASTVLRQHMLNFSVSGRFEHVQVRVKNAGLWSAWASVRVEVSYTAPATPTAVPVATGSGRSYSVTATHPAPSGGQPTVTYHDIYRQESADGASWGAAVRVSKNWPKASAWIDGMVEHQRYYQYAVEAIGDNTVRAISAYVSAP